MKTADTTTDRHRSSSVDQCRIIDLRREATDSSGTLSFVENSSLFPFAVKRTFYIYDVPAGVRRGGHSHFEEECLLVAVIGSYTVTVDDGCERRDYVLNRPWQALYIPGGLWRELWDFTAGSVALALSSTLFDEADYVRSYDRFKELTANKCIQR